MASSSAFAQNPKPPKPPTRPKSWYRASEAELRKFFLDLTSAKFRVLSGTPRVLFFKRFKNKDLIPLGIDMDSRVDDNFPVALIILKAHIDVAGGIVGVTEYAPAKYVGYVVELESGVYRTMVSTYGGRFKKALKDNSIPNDGDMLTPAQKQYLKEREKLPELEPVPLEYPYRLAPRQTCKVCVQGL